MNADVWYVPLGTDLALIYAPFHGTSTLVNRALAGIVSRCLRDEHEPVPDVAGWIRDLRRRGSRPTASRARCRPSRAVGTQPGDETPGEPEGL